MEKRTLRPRAALAWLLSAAAFLLASCGDYFQFSGDGEPWEGTMRCLNGGCAVMVADTMKLSADFSPARPDSMAVFWRALPTDTTAAKALVLGDRLIALEPGEVSVEAVLANARVADTCSVRIIDRWEEQDFSRLYPHDMVVYARLLVDGQPWQPDSMRVGAFIGGELCGLAEPREAHGISYAVLRIWARQADGVGRVVLRCYDRRRFRLRSTAVRLDFSTGQTLGTLSALYEIDFTE